MRRRRTGPDRARLLSAARLFVEGIGDRTLRAELRRTPARVAASWSSEILSGYASDPVAVLGRPAKARERGMVVVRDIPFVSVCVHHLLPFHGKAQVGYLPGGRVAGLSKIARAVDALARRLQLQERLTRQIVEALSQALRPIGAACRLEAEHLCMTARGPRKRGSSIVTTAYTGAFLRDPALRREFLALTGPAERR